MRENLAPAGDPQLQLTLDIIDSPDERQIADRGELVDYLVERGTAQDNRDLDLIGHGDAGILHLGSIVFDLTGIANLFPPAKYDPASDGISGVRLLGCNTASTVEGQRAMRLLKAIIHAPVWGTRDLLQASDYQSDGLKPGHGGLVEVDELDRVPPQTSEEVVAGWGAALDPAIAGDGRDERVSLFAGLFDQSRVATPGVPRRSPASARPTVATGQRATRWLRDVVVRAPWLGRARNLQAFPHLSLLVPPPSQAHPEPHASRPLRVDVLERGWALRLHGPAADASTLIVPVQQRSVKALLRRAQR